MLLSLRVRLFCANRYFVVYTRPRSPSSSSSYTLPRVVDTKLIIRFRGGGGGAPCRHRRRSIVENKNDDDPRLVTGSKKKKIKTPVEYTFSSGSIPSGERCETRPRKQSKTTTIPIRRNVSCELSLIEC